MYILRLVANEGARKLARLDEAHVFTEINADFVSFQLEEKCQYFLYSRLPPFGAVKLSIINACGISNHRCACIRS